MSMHGLYRILALVVVAIALRIDAVSTFLRKKVPIHGEWLDLFDDLPWFKAAKSQGSFGSLQSVKDNQDTFWGIRLKAWVGDFLKAHKGMTVEDAYIFCNVGISDEATDIAQGRKIFEDFICKLMGFYLAWY